MRRLDRTVVVVVVLIAVAIGVEPLLAPLSWILAGIAALLALSLAMGAVGDAGAWIGMQPGDAPHRKREALRRMSSGRDWHRTPPDAPDEPVDEIWARERARRRRGGR